MPTNQKAKRTTLRRLADAAYERELRKELMVLHDQFHDWLKEKMDAFSLSDAIHRFHDGPARELWARYTYLKPDMLVARAIAHGILSPEEVPPEIRADLSGTIEAFRADLNESPDATTV